MKALPLLLLLASCGPYYVGAQPAEASPELQTASPVVGPELAGPGIESASAPVQATAPKIGWDGKEIVENDRPLHGVTPGEDTHSNLLGMFMDAKQEVDQLKLEVLTLRNMKTEQDGLIEARGAAIGASEATIVSLRAELATERARASDLEARLLTAQIRRLESEKLLLMNILESGPQEVADGSLAQAKP